jgi:hypothetical protein
VLVAAIKASGELFQILGTHGRNACCMRSRSGCAFVGSFLRMPRFERIDLRGNGSCSLDGASGGGVFGRGKTGICVCVCFGACSLSSLSGSGTSRVSSCPCEAGGGVLGCEDLGGEM